MIDELMNRVMAQISPTEKNLSRRMSDLITPGNVKFRDNSVGDACLHMATIHAAISNKKNLLLALIRQRGIGADSKCSNISIQIKSAVEEIVAYRIEVEELFILSGQLMEVFRAYHDAVLNSIEQVLSADATS